MIYSNIKDTNLNSSKIVLGRDCTSKALDEKIFLSEMDVYSEYGGNHFDTAHMYCGGESERLVGKWLKGKNREKYIVTTKGAHPDLKTGASRLSKKDIEHDLDESLKRLDTDYIDLYFLHRDDESIPANEIIHIMNELSASGKFNYFGCSNWKTARIETANKYAAANGLKPFCISQIKYSLGVTSPAYKDDPTLVEMTDTEYTFYKKSDMPVMAYASQAKGFFQKKDLNDLSEKCRARYFCDKNVKRRKRAELIAANRNVSVTAVILSYLYSQKINVFPIIGGSSADQVADSLKFSDFILSSDEIKYLHGISD